MDIVREITIGKKHRKLVITEAARAKLSVEDIYMGLTFHNMGDWGEDYEFFNPHYQEVLWDDLRFFSAFRSSKKLEYWVMSRNDDSITFMLPTEYAAEWRDPWEIEAAGIDEEKTETGNN